MDGVPVRKGLFQRLEQKGRRPFPGAGSVRGRVKGQGTARRAFNGESRRALQQRELHARAAGQGQRTFAAPPRRKGH